METDTERDTEGTEELTEDTEKRIENERGTREK